MDNGWESSAQAWIDSMGERGDRGDWARQHVLDPVMLARVAGGKFGNALDVGCGEGRFCRMLKAAGVKPTGIDPMRQFIELARQTPAATTAWATPKRSNLPTPASTLSSATSRCSTSRTFAPRSPRWRGC